MRNSCTCARHDEPLTPTADEIDIEEGNIYTADDDIIVEAGPGGKLGIKTGTVLVAGDENPDDIITVSSGGECKVEAETGVGVGPWLAGGDISVCGVVINP